MKYMEVDDPGGGNRYMKRGVLSINAYFKREATEMKFWK